jgi:hypothetical protein
MQDKIELKKYRTINTKTYLKENGNILIEIQKLNDNQNNAKNKKNRSSGSQNIDGIVDTFIYAGDTNIPTYDSDTVLIGTDSNYTYRALYIDKVPTEISLVFSFFWNSIDEKTIFILEFYYKDEFFGDLFKTEFNKSDKQQICINVENYLTSIIKGLKITNTAVIKAHFENIWKNISSPKSLFNLLFKDFIIVCKDEEISLNSEILIYTKTSNSSEPIPLIKFKTDSIIISSKYCKLSFISSQKLSLPNQRLTISIKFLDKNRTLFEVNIKLLEFTTHEALVSLRRLWKKLIIDFINFFESKNKKK